METIFNYPINWAHRAVGTIKKYRFMQIMTVLLGILVFVLIFLMKKFKIPLDYFPLHVILFVLIIVFPLFYLKAIRALIELQKTEPKKTNDAEDK
jgi:ABC-type transport system involved in Fe-S cluster assembly fused permease/ATPase subunit